MTIKYSFPGGHTCVTSTCLKVTSCQLSLYTCFELKRKKKSSSFENKNYEKKLSIFCVIDYLVYTLLVDCRTDQRITAIRRLTVTRVVVNAEIILIRGTLGLFSVRYLFGEAKIA